MLPKFHHINKFFGIGKETTSRITPYIIVFSYLKYDSFINLKAKLLALLITKDSPTQADKTPIPKMKIIKTYCPTFILNAIISELVKNMTSKKIKEENKFCVKRNTITKKSKNKNK